MERILTNYQVEWLSNLRLLSNYEDDFFEKEEIAKKTSNFIENNYPEEEENIIKEFKVLEQKGFINLEISGELNDEIEYIEITKAGLDYLVILEEDFKERAFYNENILKIIQVIDTINDKKLNRKDFLDRFEQFTTIASNISSIYSSISSLGSIGQGLISLVCKNIRFIF